MKQSIETILNGETEEEILNPDCWIHYAQSGEEIPDYMIQHENQRTEAEMRNLEIEAKYSAEELYE